MSRNESVPEMKALLHTRSIPEGMSLFETTATNMTTNQADPKILKRRDDVTEQ
jgi:hypothetical protein